MHIQLTSIVGNGEAVQVGCEATSAVQVGTHNKGTRQRALSRFIKEGRKRKAHKIWLHKSPHFVPAN